MPESLPELDPKNENLNRKKTPQKNAGGSDSLIVETKWDDSDSLEKGKKLNNQPENKTQEQETKGKKPKIKVGIVDVSSGIEDKAIDAAERELEKKNAESKGVKGYFGRLWNNYFYDYERSKAKRKAKKNIEDSKNLYANEEDGSISSDKTAKLVTAKRFIEEVEGLIHTEAGEAREVLNAETAEGKKVEGEIRGLIDLYVENKISKEDFDSRKNVILSSTKEAMSKEVLDKGVIYADNILEAAEQIKALMEHSDGLDKLDYDLEIVLGKAKTGVRTEANYNKIDKFTNFVMESKVGKYVNEATLASAIAITSGILSFATKSKISQTLRSKITFGAGALITGVGAGLRESRKVKLERKSHSRQMAEGREGDEENEKESARRDKMEEARYETVGAKNMMDSLSKTLKPEATEKEVEAYFNEKMNFLANAETRIQMSDKEKIDLLHYTDVTLVEEERFALDLAKAKAKVELRKLVEEGKVKIPAGQSFDDYLRGNVETQTKLIREGDEEKGVEGMKDKDRIFRKMKRGRVAKAVVKGLATGLLVGTVTQEIGAAFQQNKIGFFEKMFDKAFKLENKGVDHATFLESVRGWIQNGKFGGGDMSFSGTELLPTVEFKIDDNTFCLPEGYDIVEVDQKIDGYALMKDGEVILNYFTVNENGTLTDEAKEAFLKEGIRFDEYISSVEADDIVREITDDEFVENHADATEHIKRDLWYGNDTPSPLFDKNELKLDWGGVDGKGIDANGNYVFDMSRMTEGGSFQGLESADAKELLAEGKLKILLSASDGTQSHPFEVTLNPDGSATIDPDSPAGKLFDMHNGKAEFLGRYAEVAEVRGETDGVEHVRILATYVGDGMDKITDTVDGGSEDIIETVIWDIGEPAVDGTFVDPTLPPIIPLDPRRGLGGTKRKTKEQIAEARKKLNPEPAKDQKVPKNGEEGEYVEEESAWRSGLDQWRAGSADAPVRAYRQVDSNIPFSESENSFESVPGYPLLTKEILKNLEGKSEEQLKNMYISNVRGLENAEESNEVYKAVGAILAMDSIIDYLDYKKETGEEIISKEDFIKSKRDGGIGESVLRPSEYTKNYLKNLKEKIQSLKDEKKDFEDKVDADKNDKKSKDEIKSLKNSIKMHEEMMKEADFLLGLNKKEIMREMRKRKGEDVKDWDENRPREAGEDEDTEIVEAPPRIVTRDMMDTNKIKEINESGQRGSRAENQGQTATSIGGANNSGWKAATKDDAAPKGTPQS